MSSYQSIPAFITETQAVIPMAESNTTLERSMMIKEGESNELNEEQLQAVSNLCGPTVVNAGAGTGKTKVLIERMRRIMQKFPAAKVLLISFTKKSALELKERIASLGVSSCQVSTLHSLSYRILVRDAGKKFTVLTSENYRKSLISRLIPKKLDIAADDVIFAMHSPSRAVPGTNAIAQKYLLQLQKNNQIDLDAMQLMALKRLEDIAVLKYWQRQYDFILVDEAQDLDEIQLAIVSKLSRHHHNLCCVGDKRQAIYGFRGAVHDVLSTLVREHDATSYDMTVNYRCSSAILGLANQLMREYRPLTAVSRFYDEALPQYLVADNELDEAQTLIKEVQKLHRDGLAYKDMAVLYRSTIASKTLLQQLLEKKIPFVCSSIAGFPYNHQPLKGMVTLLRHINAPDNKQLLKELLPMFFLKKASLKEIESIMSGRNISFIEAVKSLELPFFHKLYIEQFCDGILSASKMKPSATINSLLRAGYEKVIGKQAVPAIEAMSEEAAEFETVYAYLSHIDELHEEYEKIKSAASRADGDCLRLMTIHASKGLEFNTVFIIGAQDGSIPAANDGTDIEEERRLLYVAVTRAKERLYISYPRYNEKSATANEVSRFIREAFSFSYTKNTAAYAAAKGGECDESD